MLSCRKLMGGSVTDPTILISTFCVTRWTVPISIRNVPDDAASFSHFLDNVRIDRNEERHRASGSDWPFILC
jgi:hypothetical protein